MGKPQASIQGYEALHPYPGLLNELEELRGELPEFERLSAMTRRRVNARHQASAVNLAHYPGLELRLLHVSTSGHPYRAGCAGIVGALPPSPECAMLDKGSHNGGPHRG